MTSMPIPAAWKVRDTPDPMESSGPSVVGTGDAGRAGTTGCFAMMMSPSRKD